MIQDSYETALGEARVQLEQARKILLEEIANYPGPIAGCDVQFNVLLSDRTRIGNALKALDSEPFVPTPRILERGGVSESR